MPKRDRKEYMKNYRQRKPSKLSKLSNDDIIQKVHKFIFSDSLPDPDDSICNTLALAHIFHDSFSPSSEEIAYARKSIQIIQSNFDVKLGEAKQKIIYGLMMKFPEFKNRTAATEAFTMWWLWRCQHTPEDLKQKTIEFWKDFK